MSKLLANRIAFAVAATLFAAATLYNGASENHTSGNNLTFSQPAAVETHNVAAINPSPNL